MLKNNIDQPRLHMKNADETEDWGEKKVIVLSWNDDGVIDFLQVDFMENGSDLMTMRLDYATKKFKNSYGNLVGELKI